MDPVTTSIIAALAAGATKGATSTINSAIIDGYKGLKALLKKKFGEGSEIVDVIENLESKPDSAGRKLIVAEELKDTNAVTDPEILAAARALLAQIKVRPDGGQHNRKITGKNIAFAEKKSIAKVSVSNYFDKKNG
jgi:hypothetical protein